MEVKVARMTHLKVSLSRVVLFRGFAFVLLTLQKHSEPLLNYESEMLYIDALRRCMLVSITMHEF